MDFGLSEEQRMVVDTVRSFVERELYPLEAEVEYTGVVSDEVGGGIRQKVLDLGFYAANIPAEFGGGGLERLLRRISWPDLSRQLVEHEQRVMAGAAEVTVPDRAFLLAVGRATELSKSRMMPSGGFRACTRSI